MIQHDFPLAPLHTFQVASKARHFANFGSLDELNLILNSIPSNTKKYVLGGGSNTIFTKDYDGIILKNEILGIRKIREDEKYITVRVGAGEHWHNFILLCAQKSWYGMENLALIPGTVGASPIQNIGAYGAEVKCFIESVEWFSYEDKAIKILSNVACKFAYRDSIFKHELKNKGVITHVNFVLSKDFKANIQYPQLTKKLGDKTKTLKATEVIQAVCEIRKSKLPDPKTIPNVGSFFKNPEVRKTTLERLQQERPNIPYYLLKDDKVKIPAAYLIEQAGLKNFKRDGLATYHKHALIIINEHQAKGKAISEFYKYIQQQVKSIFDIDLVPEINIL